MASISLLGPWDLGSRAVRIKYRITEVLRRLRHPRKKRIIVEYKGDSGAVDDSLSAGGMVSPSIPITGLDVVLQEQSTQADVLVEENDEEEKDAQSEYQDLPEDSEVEDVCADSRDGPDHGSECELTNLPFVMLLERSPSELSEDVERMIFEMTARAFPSEILKTLVYVNHRVKTWVEYVLYESVILRDAKHARLFLDGLEKKHPEFVARAVKILSLPPRVSFDTSYRILEACKNIHHLSWLPTNRLTEDITALIAELPLSSLRARLVSFLGADPDFSNPLFKRLTTLCIVDHQDVWKKWTWSGMKIRPNLKWIAVNLDGRLDTFVGWAPVRTMEKMVLKPYGGPSGVQLCVCYHHNPAVIGCRWMHRTEQTFSEERMVVLSLDHRIDGERWLARVTGECPDFEISEELVKERQQKERRLHFASLLFRCLPPRMPVNYLIWFRRMLINIVNRSSLLVQ